MKRERLVALAMAVGALALFYALLFPKPQGAPAAAAPLSIEPGPEGLAAAAQWLRAGGIPVVSLRDRYGALDELPQPERGNLLIVSLPQRVPTRPEEQAQLVSWIKHGNSVLILAAIDDTPNWMAASNSDAAIAAEALTHIGFDAGAVTDGAAVAAPGARLSRKAAAARAGANTLAALLGASGTGFQPRGTPPLMLGVQHLWDSSALPSIAWRGVPAQQTGALAIAERAAPDPAQRDAVLWVEPQGAGQLILSAFAAPFSNAQIDSADNARLLANIISWARAADGRVIFDDAHQGLVDDYDPKAFFADPRLHHTLLWILCAWFIWVLGVRSLRSGQTLWRPIAATTLMEASARFFAVRVPSSSAARRLLQNFYDEIHRRRGELEDGGAPWSWLAAQPALVPEHLARLRELHARVQSGDDVSLAELQTLLSQLRGSLE